MTRWTRSVTPRLATLCGSDKRRFQLDPAAMTQRTPVEPEIDAVIGYHRDVNAYHVLLEAKVVVVVFLDDRAGGEPHQPDRVQRAGEGAQHFAEIRRTQ